MDPRVTHLEALLARFRADLEEAYRALSEPQRSRRPSDGGWSADQVIEHLAETEESILRLLTGFVSRSEVRTDAEFDPDQFAQMLDMPFFLDRSRRVEGRQPRGALDAAEAWESLTQSRAGVLALLKQAEGRRLEDSAYPHPATGHDLNGYQWVAFLALHEGRHADQIRSVSPADR